LTSPTSLRKFECDARVGSRAAADDQDEIARERLLLNVAN
jgi:hypothetical protein